MFWNGNILQFNIQIGSDAYGLQASCKHTFETHPIDGTVRENDAYGSQPCILSGPEHHDFLIAPEPLLIGFQELVEALIRVGDESNFLDGLNCKR